MPADDFHSERTAEPGGAASEEALHWLVHRLDSASWTPKDEVALRKWLAASPDNEREFRRNESVVGRMSRPEIFGEAIARMHAQAREARRLRRLAWAWAGALAAAAVVAVAFLLARPRISVQEYATGVGERREVTLPDGSRVNLDAQTRLQGRFDGRNRAMELLTGAATFQVTHDETHPFEVVAGGQAIRVVGTQFEVNLHAPGSTVLRGSLSVAVTEGVVEVRPNASSAGGSKAVRLTAGRRGLWRDGEAVPVVTIFPQRTFAVWRTGRLPCDDEPLGEVLAELERYFPGQIEISDPALAQLRVSGTLPLDDWKAAAQLLESVLPVRVSAIGSDRLVVEAASDQNGLPPRP